MGRRKQGKPRPLTPKKIDALLSKPQPLPQEPFQVTIDGVVPKNLPTSSFDTLSSMTSIGEFLKIFSDVQKKIDECAQDMQKCDLEINDLLHYLEFCPDLDLYSGYLVYLRLREARKHRRVNKNAIKFYSPIAAWASGHSEIAAAAKSCLQSATDTSRNLQNQLFKPKTDALRGLIHEKKVTGHNG